MDAHYDYVLQLNPETCADKHAAVTAVWTVKQLERAVTMDLAVVHGFLLHHTARRMGEASSGCNWLTWAAD